MTTPAHDALALPAVPPPAGARRPWRDAILVAAFVAVLALALALTLLLPAPETMRFEKRRPQAWPAIPSAKDWRAFTAAAERAFADRLAGRDALIMLHHAGKALVFKTSPVRTAMIGRDGWYFWLGEDARALDRHHRGRVPFTDAQVQALVDELARRRAYLAARGVGFVVVAVPEKYSIYPEHLPPWVVRAPRTPLDRTIDAIGRDGSVCFVDLRGPLAQGKASERLYFRTDSHWNLAGATIGYAAIMAAIQAELPPAKRRPAVSAPRPPYDPARDRYAGDLVQMMAIARFVTEEDFVPLSKLLADASRRCARPVAVKVAPGAPPREDYACADTSLPRLLMLHDSMAIPLVPLLAENFARSVFVNTQALDPTLVDEIMPDVVVEQFVERAMDAPAAAAFGRGR